MFVTCRLIELLEHEPSHLILSHILATGAPDAAFLQVLAKCRTSSKGLEPWKRASGRTKTPYLITIEGVSDFRRSKIMSHFVIPSRL